MPVSLHEELADKWLEKIESAKDQEFIEELIQQYPEEELDAYTVGKLRVRTSLVMFLKFLNL
jgi:putative SOS response-associated peptidase YedK